MCVLHYNAQHTRVFFLIADHQEVEISIFEYASSPLPDLVRDGIRHAVAFYMYVYVCTRIGKVLYICMCVYLPHTWSKSTQYVCLTATLSHRSSSRSLCFSPLSRSFLTFGEQPAQPHSTQYLIFCLSIELTAGSSLELGRWQSGATMEVVVAVLQTGHFNVQKRDDKT